jgi:GAF domain-containing protein
LFVFAAVLRYLVKSIRKHQAAERTLGYSGLLQPVQQDIDSAISLQEVLDRIIHRAVHLVGARDGSLMLMEEDGSLHFRARCGGLFPVDKEERTFTPGAPDQGIAGWVAQNRRPYVCRDINTDSKFVDIVAGPSICSLVSVPIISHGTVLGVINVDSSEPDRFSETDAELLVALADQVAVTIERAELLESLRQVGEKTFDDAGDPHQHIVDAVHRFIRCPVAMWRVDKTGKQAKIVASRRVRTEYAQKAVVDLDRSVTGKAIREREIVQVLDIQADPDFQNKEAAAREGWQSYLAVPLLVGPERAVGTLSIYGERKREQFTRWELDLLRAFAGQAGVVIRNADLAKELAVLNEIGQAVSVLGVEAIANLVYQKTSQLMDTTNFFLCLYNKKMDRLDIKTWIHNGRSLEPFSCDLSVSGPTGWVIQEERSLLIRDWDEEEQDFPVKPYIVTERQRSWLGVPLCIGEEVLGVMSVQSPHPNAFDLDNQRVLEIIANQAAVAIENARLYEESQNRLKLLDALNKTSLETVQRLDLKELMPAIIERAASLMAGERHRGIGAAYWRCDYEMQRAVIEYSPNPVLVGVELGLDEGLAGEVIRTGKAKYVNDYPQWPQHAAIFDKEDLAGLIKNVIEVPIKEDEKVIAILSVSDASGQRRFGDIDIELLERFANLTTIAIQNARLFDAAQERAQTLTALYEAGQFLVSASDLDAVLRGVVERAQAFLKADAVVLYEYNDKKGDILVPPTFAGVREPKILQEIGEFHKDTIAMKIIRSEKSWYAAHSKDSLVPDSIRPEGAPQPFVVRENIESSAGILLRARGKIVGVLFINYRTLHVFDDREREKIELFANQAAIAVRNATLFDTITKQRDELQTINEIGKLLMTTLETREIPRRLIQELIPLLRIEAGSLWIIDRSTDRLDFHFSLNQDGEEDDITEKLRALPEGAVVVGNSIAGNVARSGLPRIVNDVREAVDWNREIDKITGFKTRSILAIPLRLGTETVAVIELLNRAEEDPFTEEDENLVTAIASVAALAIENTRLYGQRTKDIAALQEVNAAITTASWKEISELILEKATELTQAELSGLWVINENKNQLLLGAMHGEEPKQDWLPIDDGSINGLVAMTGKSHNCPDVSDDPYYLLWYEDVKSSITVPLRFGDQIVGTLYTESVKLNAFSNYQLGLLQSLADQAAVAIETAWLFKELEERATQLERLQKITATISAGSSDLDKVLGLIVSSLGEMFGGASCAIRLYDSKRNELGRKVAVGPLKDWWEPPRPDGTSRFVISTKTPLYVENALATPPDGQPTVRRKFIEQGTRAAACLPLVSEEDVKGILYLNLVTPHQFSPITRQVLGLFADQATVVIENARLYEQRVKDLAALQQVNEAIVSEEWDRVSQLIVDKAVEVMPGEYSSLWLKEPTTDDLVREAIAGPAEAINWEFDRLKAEWNSISVRVAKTGNPEICEDVEQESEFYRIYQPAQSSMAVPLKRQGEVIGVLNVESSQPKAFVEQQCRLLESFADQAAIAIENARLLRQEITLREQTENLQEVLGATKAALELEEVAGKILDKLAEIVEYRRASLQLIREDARVLVAGRGFDVDSSEAWFLRPISQDHLVSRIVASKAPLILSETAKDSDWEARPGTDDVKSWIGTPLVYDQETVGFVTLDHDQAGFYQQDTKDLLVSFANQAAFEVWQARLFDSAQRLIRDLEIVNEIVQIISTKLDTGGLLQTIVSQIADRLNCTHCTVFFPQREKDELLLVPEETHGVRSEQIKTRRFKLDEGLVGWVFQNGKSLVLDDARGDPRFAPAREGQDRPRSMLVVPVKVGDQTIGVISADQDRFGWFSESDRRLVDALARHAGIAIERATGLQLLQDVGNQIISLQHVGDILRQVVSGAIKLTNTNSGVIYLISEDGQSVIGSFHPPDFDHPEPRLERKEGLTRYVIKTGEVLCIPDIRQDRRVNPVLLDHFLSMIAVPLKIEQSVIGVLYLNDADLHDFTETEVSLLLTLASQAASAIENAKLFEQIQEQRVAQIRAIKEISKSIAAPLELGQVLEGILDWTVALIGEASLGEVRLLDRKTNELVVKAFRGEPIEEQYLKIPVGKGITGWVAQHGKSQMVPDILKDDRFLPFLENTRSEMAVPMLRGDELVGVLNIEHPQINAFTESDVKLAEATAGLAVVAIENARLFKEVEERAKLLVQLQQVTTIISAEPFDLGKVLGLVVGSLNEIFLGASCGIRLYDSKADEFAHHVVAGVLEKRWLDRTPRPDGTSRYVVKTKAPRYIENTTIAPLDGGPAVHEGLVKRGVKAVAYQPLLSEGDVIGILYVDLTTPRRFSENDKRILELFADQAAIAIENARLYQELRKKVAELERAQNRIAEAEAVATRMSIAADLVHRLNNLAGTIPVWVDLVRERLDVEAVGDEKLTNYLDSIETDVGELLRATEKLKSISEEQDIDIKSTLEALVRQALVQTPADIEVDLDCEAKLPAVHAVDTELTNAFWSIIENGIEAMPDGGTLKVKAELTIDVDSKEWVKIEISDAGKGIAKGEVDKVFTPFYSTRAGHMGYGLWRARSVFERIGGNIVFESEEGIGTTFIIRLPISEEANEYEN